MPVCIKEQYILTLSLILRTSIISIPISTTFTLSVKGNSNFEYDFGRHRFLLGASAHMCSLDLTPRFIRSWAFKIWQFNFHFFSGRNTCATNCISTLPVGNTSMYLDVLPKIVRKYILWWWWVSILKLTWLSCSIFDFCGSILKAFWNWSLRSWRMIFHVSSLAKTGRGESKSKVGQLTASSIDVVVELS